LTNLTGIDPQTSAIAPWNGFLYQGKVALYVVIRMILKDQNSQNFKLRLEHLDDFAIFNSDDNAVSVHQVKAEVANNRSHYNNALSKSSKIYSDDCDESTRRYFHVCSNIIDFQDYCENDSLVTFYKNHNNHQFIDLDDIEAPSRLSENESKLIEDLTVEYGKGYFLPKAHGRARIDDEFLSVAISETEVDNNHLAQFRDYVSDESYPGRRNGEMYY